MEELKPSEKEEATFINAMQALMNGKCIENDGLIYKVNSSGGLIYYDDGQWIKSMHTEWISAKLFFIVPDPSKPTEVEDEYKKDWQKVEQADTNGKAMKYFLEKYFVRKP